MGDLIILVILYCITLSINTLIETADKCRRILADGGNKMDNWTQDVTSQNLGTHLRALGDEPHGGKFSPIFGC